MALRRQLGRIFAAIRNQRSPPFQPKLPLKLFPTCKTNCFLLPDGILARYSRLLFQTKFWRDTPVLRLYSIVRIEFLPHSTHS